jgi:hypothetical protein
VAGGALEEEATGASVILERRSFFSPQWAASIRGRAQNAHKKQFKHIRTNNK